MANMTAIQEQPKSQRKKNERGLDIKNGNSNGHGGFTLHRLPKDLQSTFERLTAVQAVPPERLAEDAIHEGDALALLPRVECNSVALSVWSPPYFVGKNYESHLTFDEWQSLLRDVI